MLVSLSIVKSNWILIITNLYEVLFLLYFVIHMQWNNFCQTLSNFMLNVSISWHISVKVWYLEKEKNYSGGGKKWKNDCNHIKGEYDDDCNKSHK